MDHNDAPELQYPVAVNQPQDQEPLVRPDREVPSLQAPADAPHNPDMTVAHNDELEVIYRCDLFEIFL